MKPVIMPESSAQPAFTDESDLIARARQGDGEAFTQLVNRYERKIFRLAKHITQNEEDAEDVLQDTFLKAYEHLDGFQEQSKFYTWLVRIAVNEVADEAAEAQHRQDASRWTRTSTPARRWWRARSPSGTTTPSSATRARRCRRSCGRRSTAWPPYSEPCSCCATSTSSRPRKRRRRLGISVPAVKSRLLRARLQLRDKLTRFFKRKADDVFAYL